MKLTKTIVIFIILSLSLTFPAFISSHFNNRQGNDGTNTKNLKTSDYLIIPPIHIDGNWSHTAGNYTWCTGDGSWGNPYVIQGIEINGENSGNCITIQNTNDSFIIQNCLLINSSYPQSHAGIKLTNVNNGQIIGNNCSVNNYFGILISGSNNTVSGNVIIWNRYGIKLSGNDHIIYDNIISSNNYGMQISGDNHTISNNTISNNKYRGIELQYQTHGTITNNTIFMSQQYISVYGITLDESNENNITWNEISSYNTDRDYGIRLQDSDWNIIANNTIYDNFLGGIVLHSSHHNDIVENILDRTHIGIRLRLSNYNNIIENTIVYYYECINQSDCEGNYILNNDCELIERTQGVSSIFGYDTILVISILCATSLFLLKRNQKCRKF